MAKKLFIVHTRHGSPFEANPYIGLADDEQEAKQLVEKSGNIVTEQWRREENQAQPLPQKSWWLIWKRSPEPKKLYALGISDVKEIPLTDSKIVWKAINVE